MAYAIICDICGKPTVLNSKQYVASFFILDPNAPATPAKERYQVCLDCYNEILGYIDTMKGLMDYD